MSDIAVAPYFKIIEVGDNFVHGKIDFDDMSMIYGDIDKEVNKSEFEEGLLGLDEDDDEPDPDVRSTSVVWLTKCKKIKRILFELVSEINDDWFSLDISKKAPDYQYTLYTTPGDHYDWHQDQYKNEVDPEFERTLSMSLCLTPSDFYEGAELFLRDGYELNVRVFKMGFGEFVIFPATTEHRVNALRQGERASLVVWYGKEPAQK